MKSIRKWQAQGFLWLDLAYVVVLVILMIGRQAHWLALGRIHNPIGGIIPLGVPWFGALGAVTISLYGVVDHADGWQTRWNLWHVARPVVGAILGTVGYLIFIAVIQATGTTPTSVGPTKSGSIVLVTYLVLAFAIGFREETFRALIERVVDILLSPGDTTGAAAVQVSPSPVEFDNVPVAGPAGPANTKILTVRNSGNRALVVDGTDANPRGTQLTGAGAAQFTLENNSLEGATINPGASALLTIRFSPQAQGQQQATLTINCNAGKFPIAISGTGT
jgi:hypothetical protein